MTYRPLTKEDIPGLEKFCEEHNFPLPSLSLCFIAEVDGKMVGFINGGMVNYIDAIASDNPVAAVGLFHMMQGFLMGSSPNSILAGVINPSAGEMLQKFGYTPLDEAEFFLKRR